MKQLKNVDRQIRNSMRTILHLRTDLPCEYFYIPQKEGGLGLMSFAEHIPRMKTKLHLKMLKSADLQMNAAANCSLLQSEFIWAKHFSGLTGVQSNKDIFRAAKQVAENRHTTLGDKFLGRHHAPLAQSHPSAHEWLLWPILTGGEFITGVKLYSSSLPTRQNTSIGKIDANRTCRRCFTSLETETHILQTCPSMKNAICKRHNTVMYRLGRELQAKLAEVRFEPWVNVNGENLRPDIVAKCDDTIFVIDVAISYETSMEKLKSTRAAKEKKYECLKSYYLNEVASVFVIGFVVGSRGVWPKWNDSILQQLGLSVTFLTTCLSGHDSSLAQLLEWW